MSDGLDLDQVERLLDERGSERQSGASVCDVEDDGEGPDLPLEPKKLRVENEASDLDKTKDKDSRESKTKEIRSKDRDGSEYERRDRRGERRDRRDRARSRSLDRYDRRDHRSSRRRERDSRGASSTVNNDRSGDERHSRSSKKTQPQESLEAEPKDLNVVEITEPVDLPEVSLEDRKKMEVEEKKRREYEEARRDDLTVLVLNTSLKATERDVWKFFSEHCGKVRDIQVIRDQRSGKSKGVSYVEFYTQEGVIKALALSGQLVLGVPIKVQASQAEKNRAARAAKQQQEEALEGGPMRIYVGGLVENLSNITDTELKQLFSPFGEVTQVELHRDPYTGRSKGYAFVQYRKAQDAREAMAAMNGFEIAGRQIKLSLCWFFLVGLFHIVMMVNLVYNNSPLSDHARFYPGLAWMGKIQDCI